MFWLLGLLIYGLIIGLIGKAIHPGDDPVGCLPTIGIGIAGTYTGGLISFLLGRGQFGDTSGIIFSIIGSIIFLAAWRWWTLKQQKRSFWTGKR